MRLLAFGIAAAGLFSIVSAAAGQNVYGITRDNRLVSFNPATPGTLATDAAITGLGAGESVLGIDVRPFTGEIVIVGSSNRLYTVTPAGAASVLGSAPGFTALATPLSSFDFNPTVDRVRVVDVNGGNRRLNPVTGGDVSPVNDASLSYAAGGTPRAAGVAYTNAQFGPNVPAGSVRELFIDSALNTLGEIGTMAGGNASFNGGVSTTIGPLGFDLGDDAGFDIFGPSGAAYLSNLTANGASFYTINLNTGLASLVGQIGSGSRQVTDIAAIPAPGAAAMFALGIGALPRRRR